MAIDKDNAERWSSRIVLGAIILAIVIGAILLASLGRSAPAFRADAQLRPIPELTDEHRAALLDWVNKQEKIEGSLKANLAAITLSAAAGDAKLASAQSSVAALEKERKKERNGKWKAMLFGFPITAAVFLVAGLLLSRVASVAAFVGKFVG